MLLYSRGIRVRSDICGSDDMTPEDKSSPNGDESGDENDRLLPVRMLNEYAYCPRLFHFMHVEGIWEDNDYTLDGKLTHRRIESRDQTLPDAKNESENGSEYAGEEEQRDVSRSVTLGSARLGIIGKLDAVMTDGNVASPVETKRGSVPPNDERSYEPERVQLIAQGMLLREHGYEVSEGVLYYAGSKTRVVIPFTPDLEARTLQLIEEARVAASRPDLPAPLEDSPKCTGCSLNGICLPDETRALRLVPPDPAAPGVRRLYPARPDAVPLYVQAHGALVGVKGKSLVIRKDGEELAKVGLKDVSQLVLCANVRTSTQATHLLCEAGVPIVYLSSGHWFYGITVGNSLKNAYNRAAQFTVAANYAHCLQFAKQVVTAKAANQRTMLRRNAAGPIAEPLKSMSALIAKIDEAQNIDELLGLEGNIARIYFENFSQMLRPAKLSADWDFAGRNRRPPKDPINALLSFGYALLTKECTVALNSEGLDPWWGLYHRPRHGRPALALDLMEEFRSIIADSAVITAVNNGMVTRKDFIRSKSGCLIKPNGRKAFIRAYEGRLDQLVAHPVFDYRCAWRSIIKLQARLLARWLRGDIPQYPGMTTR